MRSGHLWRVLAALMERSRMSSAHADCPFEEHQRTRVSNLVNSLFPHITLLFWSL